MSNYEKLYEANEKKYNEMLEKYNNLISSSEYRTALYSTPFDFLRTLYLAKRIDLYVNAPMNNKPVFNFSSAQEALATYSDLIHFKKNTADLLDKASLITQAKSIADKINNFILLSDYLDDSLMIVEDDERVSDIARECLQVLPSVAKEINADLRLAILSDICNTFNEKQMSILIQKRVFKEADIDNLIKRVNSEEGKANIEAICKHYNLDVVPIKTVDLRLKGTTFSNDDGSSRQENIKALEEYIKSSNVKPVLQVEPYIYKPDIGAEEPAVRILWGDKELGVLPRDVSIELHENWTDKTLTAKVKDVVGGGQISYGVEITLDVCEKAKQAEKETTELDKE